MKLRLAKLAVCATALVAFPSVSLSATDGEAEPPFRFYSTIDGLTQSDVSAIGQDSAGYLWFTTARGLNRYDGRDFDKFTIADGLPSNNLTALHIDSNNAVWVGDARGGLAVIRGTRVVHIVDPIGDESTAVTDIEFAGDRILVVAEGAGILEVVADGSGHRLLQLGARDVGAKDIAVHGEDIWLAAESGLYRVGLGATLALRHLSASITLVHIDEDGTVWAVDDENRIYTIENDAFRLRARIAAPAKLIGLATGADGDVWAATENKLYGFDGAALEVPSNENEIRSYGDLDEITSLFIDRENTVWLSSDARLIRFLGDRFRHYRLKTGSDSETVWAISEDTQGRIWFGTQTKLLLQNADESLTIVGPDNGIPRGPTRDVVRGAGGRLWAGIRGEGLYRVDTDRLRGQLIAGTEGLEILDVSSAPDTAIWFSTFGSGLYRYSPGQQTLEHYPVPEDTSVYSLDIGSNGDVWYGADEVGLVRLTRESGEDSSQKIFGPELGLRNTFFDQLRLTGMNEAWIAMDEGGLYRFEGGRFTNHGARTPLADQTVYLVETLQNGTVVVGGEQGLYQFNFGSPRMAHYNQLAGFTGVETNVHASFIDSTGHLWIGTIDGATRMDSTLPIPEQRELTPQILSMESDADRMQIEDGATIDPGQGGLMIEFGAVSLLNPRGIEYSYRLRGMDDAWGTATSNHSVRYSGLPPGSYEFAVRARYPGGDWSRQAASRQFTTLPFFWQRAWFVLSVLAIAALGIRAAMIYRTRNIEQTNRKLRVQVMKRTRSINRARRRLEESNEQLSREIIERRKADQARAKLETTFRRAFENAPIGMGLLNAEGQLFDANPALKSMFWPRAESADNTYFSDVIDNQDRERFAALYEKLTTLEVESLEEKFDCVSARGDLLQTMVNLSTVRSDNGKFLYSVLQVQDLTESLRLTDKLEYQASYDELTGLLNRRAFESELARAWEKSRPGKTLSYLLFMDLDQFKVVNDTSGHAAGDQLLRRVSEIILENVRGDDIVCRLGGDEFAIVLWDCPTDVATRIAEAIRLGIDGFRFQWDSETYRIGVSIGGLPIDPDVGSTSELQQLADAACYAAKEAGRNRVHMVEGDKDSARIHQGQVRWIQRIRDAMDNNRFAIYAQVIKPLDKDVVEPERLEILLRLRDPESRKLIPPGAFLPAAERYGLSVELDEWVVRNLLDALFVHRSFHAEDRSYWINLSGASVGDKRFAQFLVDAIRHSPLPPGTVNFEITETAVIRSVVEAGRLMSELREMGCQFALDDFGSGLSSFGYLKKLPVDYLKIDGMFIRDIMRDKTDRIFVKSIIDIARTLNIKTIAEFIEDPAMLDIMRELGADYVQGFAIGRPYPLAPQFPQNAAAASVTGRFTKQAS